MRQLAELRNWLLETHQVSVSVTLMWEAPGPVGPDAQKRPCTPRRQNRPEQIVARARSEWRENQPTLNPRRLIFIDETWTKTNMVRLRSRARTRHSADRHHATRPLEDLDVHCRPE